MTTKKINNAEPLKTISCNISDDRIVIIPEDFLTNNPQVKNDGVVKVLQLGTSVRIFTTQSYDYLLNALTDKGCELESHLEKMVDSVVRTLERDAIETNIDEEGRVQIPASILEISDLGSNVILMMCEDFIQLTPVEQAGK